MELKFIKESEVDKIYGNLRHYIDNNYYIKNNAWLEEELGSNSIINTGIMVSNIELVDSEKKSTDKDFENAKLLYTSLKNLTPEQAADNRLWIYLTHCKYWNYMRKRWPIESIEENQRFGRIKNRFFMVNNGNKALLRNGLSRLWWIVYITYDENFDDPYELTKYLFKNSDFQVGLLDRTFSRNTDITKKIIQAVKKCDNDGINSEYKIKRDKIRSLLKRINSIGGVKVLDLMDYKEIEEIVFSELK